MMTGPSAPEAPIVTGPDMTQMGPPAYGPIDHSHHHQYPDYPPDYYKYGLSGVDVYPEVIYDDHDHYHHHDHAVLPPPPPLPEAPKPDPPEEPRVKKYSYYYIGRKLWYIPLYFTLWFCLYVTALIIRSIGRHKVTIQLAFIYEKFYAI